MTDCAIETIRVCDLVTGYRGRHGNIVVAKGINASLSQGELTCLIGPNGAGKSTLLKTLAGMIPPLGGEIFINGREIRKHSAIKLAREAGVVLTEKLMLSNMTVSELVALGRSPYTGFWGKLSDYDRRIVDESIDSVHIDFLRYRMIQTLSDGERQKVMIAKALAQETPIIFLDEPTAFLDYPSKVEILQLLLSLARSRNKTVFMSTHDLELALQIADKVWLIDKELGVRIGTPEDLALDGELDRYFQRPGVEFDVDSGLFRLSNNIRAYANVSGCGSRFNMVCKALRRIGVEPVSDCQDMAIEVGPSSISVNGREVENIAALLDAVRNISVITY